MNTYKRATSGKTSGLYNLDIRRMEAAIQKLNHTKPRPNACFKSLSREKLYTLDAKSDSVAPAANKYNPSHASQYAKRNTTIDSAPLRRE